jgi:hypothetical protein
MAGNTMNRKHSQLPRPKGRGSEVMMNPDPPGRSKETDCSLEGGLPVLRTDLHGPF